MPDHLKGRSPGGPLLSTVPELVEVVYMPASHAALIRELARMRCEADEALEALVCWRNRYWAEVVSLASWDRDRLAVLAGMLDHCIDHVRWVQDPRS